MQIATPLSGELGQYLDLSSAELKLTAQNMANVNTPGYTREEAVFDENVPVTLNGLTYGTGTSVTGIDSQRDRVLEQSVDQQSQAAQGTASRLTALESLQGVFSSETATSTTASNGGISSSLSGFFSAIAQLEGDPATIRCVREC